MMLWADWVRLAGRRCRQPRSGAAVHTEKREEARLNRRWVPIEPRGNAIVASRDLRGEPQRDEAACSGLHLHLVPRQQRCAISRQKQ